jgi:hypothetical protein
LPPAGTAASGDLGAVRAFSTPMRGWSTMRPTVCRLRRAAPAGRLRRAPAAQPDGTLQPSVRAFPTPWQLATDTSSSVSWRPARGRSTRYTGGLSARQGARDRLPRRRASFRRAAFDEVRPFDEFFLFSEETDWCYRLREAGWQSFFYPGAEVVHVGGAAGGPSRRPCLRSRCAVTSASSPSTRGRRRPTAAGALLAGLRLRQLVFRGERGRLPERCGLAAIHTLTRWPLLLAAPPLLVGARFLPEERPGPRSDSRGDPLPAYRRADCASAAAAGRRSGVRALARRPLRGLNRLRVRYLHPRRPRRARRDHARGASGAIRR